MYNFLSQIALNIFKYILFIKRIEPFCPGDVINIRVLVNFGLKTHKDFLH